MRPTPRLLLYTYSTQRGSCAVWSLSVFGTGVSPAKMHEPIEMRFRAQIRVNPRNRSVDGGPDRSREDMYDRVMCRHLVDSRLQSSLPLVATSTTQQGRHTAAMRSVATITVTLSQVQQIDLRQLSSCVCNATC